MTIGTLKQEIIDTLDGIEKEDMDLCSLKEYAEIVKVVSEIKDKEAPVGGFGDIISMPFNGSVTASPRTIRQLREGRKYENREDD